MLVFYAKENKSFQIIFAKNDKDGKRVTFKCKYRSGQIEKNWFTEKAVEVNGIEHIYLKK